MALYSREIVFQSPRVITLLGETDGTLYGKDAVRDYWRRLFDKRPDLTVAVERVFQGVGSIALEYRVGDVRGVEFMTPDDKGLISFACGNDIA